MLSTKKICIVGPCQSGSTRLFNLVRCIYEKKEKKVLSRHAVEFSIEKLDQYSGQYDVILGKLHSTSVDYINNYDIKLMPIRNLIDCAISAVIRFKTPVETENLHTHYKNHIHENMSLYDKFKNHVDLIIRYEEYSVNQVKNLCKLIDIELSNKEILEIMIDLEEMKDSKEIVENDDRNNSKYKKTLLSQSHNTSGGKTNKFLNLPIEVLDEIIDSTFLISSTIRLKTSGVAEID